ncbi:MAG: putative phosphoribosyl transferase [Chlamydiae bacterium]|nr:putative phosphoribosyl transferase [Chlamydiota bacterium]
MLFANREEAGEKLAEALKDYKGDENTILIALPRGGVVVGLEVAKHLSLPLDIVCPRKIGAPFNPEYAIGAVTETGEGIISQTLIQQLGITESYLKETLAEESKQAKWRHDHYRKGRPPRNLQGKRVILIDDGLATGSTMRAAIKTVKREEASEIVVAVPVSPKETFEHLEQEVDKLIALATPTPFYAVGQFYDSFDQTTDEEVIALLSQTAANPTS